MYYVRPTALLYIVGIIASEEQGSVQPEHGHTSSHKLHSNYVRIEGLRLLFCLSHIASPWVVTDVMDLLVGFGKKPFSASSLESRPGKT
jgi:hypothetical protein